MEAGVAGMMGWLREGKWVFEEKGLLVEGGVRSPLWIKRMGVIVQ